jgi:hypothetical protein
MARQKMLSRMVRVKAKNLDSWIAGLSEEEKGDLAREWIELSKALREAVEAFVREAIPMIAEWARALREAIEEIGPPNVLEGPKPKEERNTQENPSTPAE